MSFSRSSSGPSRPRRVKASSSACDVLRRVLLAKSASSSARNVSSVDDAVGHVLGRRQPAHRMDGLDDLVDPLDHLLGEAFRQRRRLGGRARPGAQARRPGQWPERGRSKPAAARARARRPEASARWVGSGVRSRGCHRPHSASPSPEAPAGRTGRTRNPHADMRFFIVRGLVPSRVGALLLVSTEPRRQLHSSLSLPLGTRGADWAGVPRSFFVCVPRVCGRRLWHHRGHGDHLVRRLMRSSQGT